MNNTIFSALRTNDLTLNVDSLLPADVNAMRAILRECNFPSITLSGSKEFNAQIFHENHESAVAKYQAGLPYFEDAGTQTKKPKASKKSATSDALKSKLKPQFTITSPKEFSTFMETIGLFIARSSNPSSTPPLTCIKIVNLSLTAASLAGICIGLQKSSTVKELYIQNCGVTSEVIDKGMVPYMAKIKSLILLDLSFNHLDGHSGGLIGKLLSSHSLNRDEAVWLCGLRGEVPETDVNLEGICEVNLMGNNLDDRSV